MAKAGTLWDEIKASLKKSVSGKKPEDDDEPNPLNTDGSDGDGDDDDETVDATVVLKSLDEKVSNLEENITVLIKAQTALLGKLEASESMQKSLGEGILAIMDRTEEVLASPAPRKGAVTQLEAAMAKAMGGGAVSGAAGTGDGMSGGGLKPFTSSTFNMAKDILTKAVSDGEINILTCGKWETQMNKSVGKASYPFTDDFVSFMKKKLSA